MRRVAGLATRLIRATSTSLSVQGDVSSCSIVRSVAPLAGLGLHVRQETHRSASTSSNGVNDTAPAAHRSALPAGQCRRDKGLQGGRLWWRGWASAAESDSPGLGIANKLVCRRSQHETRIEEQERLHAAVTFQVVEFLPDGTVTERDETAESLGLEPRDVSLFQPRPAGLDSPQRATLTPRGPLILFRTEAASAVISAKRACVFPCRKQRDSVAISQGVLDHVMGGGPLPFELRVLEALLEGTTRHFKGRHRRLALLAEGMEEDMNRTLKTNGGDLQRLLPIQRALTEIQHDVKEAREAVESVVDSDTALNAVCLSEAASQPQWVGGRTTLLRRSAAARLAAALLESYERQIQSVEGALREMGENLDVVREVWGMHLAATRNRIIRINLLVTVGAFALTACIVPASFFGMNLQHGLENASPAIFWSIVTYSATTSVALFAAVYIYWRLKPFNAHKKRVSDMKALRDLVLYNADDLEDVLAALSQRAASASPDPHMQLSGDEGTEARVTRDEFEQLVRNTLMHREVRPDEIDLLYRVLDVNQNGFLEAEELERFQTRLRGGQNDPVDDASLSLTRF